MVDTLLRIFQYVDTHDYWATYLEKKEKGYISKIEDISISLLLYINNNNNKIHHHGIIINNISNNNYYFLVYNDISHKFIIVSLSPYY